MLSILSGPPSTSRPIIEGHPVSTTWAFGESGTQIRDETFTRNTSYRTVYEQTKTEAHRIASQYQERGLPLIIVCPNGVVGPNDHSVLGYLLRLYLNKLLPPMAWSPHSISSFVEVSDLAKGISLAAEKARTGETYLFCGESKSVREIFDIWAKKPGAFKNRVWFPSFLTALSFWPLEPLQRAVGLPAVMSRETVRVASSNLNYSGEKAKRELGWTYQTAEEMWFNAIDRELELLSKRRNHDLISRLKPVESDG